MSTRQGSKSSSSELAKPLKFLKWCIAVSNNEFLIFNRISDKL